jgi:hypothetical protein
MTVRTHLKAGGHNLNHNEALRVRTALKAGGEHLNHNEALRVRTTLKAGGQNLNHNETVRRDSDRPAISMLRQPRTTGRKDHRLVLLVVRANLRAGRARNLVSARGRR